ncbi:MAG: EAL domain-containing protein [Pseudomonadaceae bacterium]|nr:EAL domain-containing protein [Pseudomonadaceae bacterium]
MSVQEVLLAVDLDKYHDLFTPIAPDSLAIALVEGNAVVKQVGDATACTQILSSDDLTDGVFERHSRDIHSYQYETVAQVVVCFRATDHSCSAALIDSLAHCIQTEVSLNAELTEMTDELTSRYEELNLVFQDKDDRDNVSNTDRQLNEIVVNSHHYLQVSFCIMLLNNQNLHFESITDDVHAPLIRSLSDIAKPINAWLQENPGSHVYNNGLEHELSVSSELRSLRHIITPITFGNDNNVTGFLLVGRPQSESIFTNSDKNLLEVMAQKASKIVRTTYDDLTGLLWRAPFELNVEQAVANSKPPPNRDGLLVIDIDRMQVVNEAYGHDAGDALLRLVGKKLDSLINNGDIIARIGGDQFGVLVNGSQSLNVHRIAARIVDGINTLEFSWRGETVEVSASAGITLLSSESGQAAHALAEAELACSSAKEAGGGRFEIFNSDDSQLVERHAQMHQVSVIQHALKNERFVLYAQPIVPLADPDREPHAEILIRLLDDDGNIVPPGAFLPAAERYNLMPSIDRWVVSRTLKAVTEHAASAPENRLVITINLSGQSLSDTGFIDFIRHCLDQYKPRPGSICFEVTETAAIRDLTLAEAFMTELRSRGVSFALDDFGTGLSSFSYLQKLPLDALKIDGSFVRDIMNDPVAATMVQAINDVGHAMGLVTIAEFVTDKDIASKLTTFGIDYGQGFALAKPMPVEAFLASFDTPSRWESAL